MTRDVSDVFPPGIPIRSADAATRGIPPSALRRRAVEHPFRGVSGFELDVSTVRQCCEAFEPIMLPDQVFSHATAVALHRAPLPPMVDLGILHVAVPYPRTPPRRRGVVGHRVSDVEVVLMSGLRVVSGPDAFCQLGSVLRVRDLVAIGDSLVTGRRRGANRAQAHYRIDDLRRAAARHRGGRGALSVSRALELVRSGADSRPETWLRLLLLEAGLMGLELDSEIDVGSGIRLHPDIAFRAERVALEYEGDVHRVDVTTWRRDIERRELMEAAGWRVIRITADDVFVAPARLVERVRRILESR